VDTSDDQLGTQAQDIRSVDFAYDAAASQIVYTMQVGDFGTTTSSPRQNNSWSISSNFGTTTIFVRAAVTETGTPRFTYGRITLLANGSRNQQNLGDADAGSLDVEQDRITIRLALAKVNAAVGSSVLFTTSTQAQAQAQILVGTSMTGGLLLAADAAEGDDWNVGEPPPPSDPPPPAPACEPGTERLVGRATAAAPASIAVVVTCAALQAQLNFHPGNASVVLELLDGNGNVVGSTSGHSRMIVAPAAAPHTYRVTTTAVEPVEFVIKSTQGQ
jgi:hypothetical protein